ncbi:hypothetical protein [Novosphingobium malaysiense]|uniref:AttH domain-containing protein n=1 Tax=Novosphingobium malaysiense TaxID=1348853 RepID=A0A0B1ZH56_9SPHN|nr:hypothetical protein [Novosphingobium malaysiense]KHK89852.1 hypothetical protein LK12_18250 [Novosphingobium malaysiense]
MTTDLTGGFDPSSEYVLTEPQTTPGMQEGVNWWLWDDDGRFGMPRLAVEAYAPDWNNQQVQINVIEPGGRLLRNWDFAPAHKVLGPDGKASHFGSGGLWFDCIEPFRHYRAKYFGAAYEGTFAAMVKPDFATGKLAGLAFDIEAECVVPPWKQGTMSSEASERMASGTEADFMGGKRVEQLCRIKGTVNLDGRNRAFTGGALRIRRTGVRKITGFWGHCWQSAVFPSGKAFGYIAYPPRPDGAQSYNEGYLFLGDGELIPARVVQAPWLTEIRFSGEDVGLVLETADGARYQIGGETFGGMPSIHSLAEMPPLLQSIVRYSWDGESAYGMMERSNLAERVTMPA